MRSEGPGCFRSKLPLEHFSGDKQRMILREANKNDLPELMAFYLRMNQVINERFHDYVPENEPFPPKEMVVSAIEEKEQIIGVEDGKIILGVIVNQDDPEAYGGTHWQVEAKKGEFWTLHALRVAPEYEGRGCAKAALAHVIDLAAKRGKKAIRLDVMEGYWVRRLYESFGFRYIRTVEILYADIGHPEHFDLLEKVIE